jgi:hypothetical protein
MVNCEAPEEVFYQFTKSNREKRKWKSLNNWADPHKGAQPALTLHTWAHLSVARWGNLCLLPRTTCRHCSRLPHAPSFFPSPFPFNACQNRAAAITAQFAGEWHPCCISGQARQPMATPNPWAFSWLGIGARDRPSMAGAAFPLPHQPDAGESHAWVHGPLSFGFKPSLTSPMSLVSSRLVPSCHNPPWMLTSTSEISVILWRPLSATSPFCFNDAGGCPVPWWCSRSPCRSTLSSLNPPVSAPWLTPSAHHPRWPRTVCRAAAWSMPGHRVGPLSGPRLAINPCAPFWPWAGLTPRAQ